MVNYETLLLELGMTDWSVAKFTQDTMCYRSADFLFRYLSPNVTLQRH